MADTSNLLCRDKERFCLAINFGNLNKKCSDCPTGYINIGTGGKTVLIKKNYPDLIFKYFCYFKECL